MKDMHSGPGREDRNTQYAVVSYIPDPLAGFLDRLRCELVPNCFLRAHITLLPPRCLTVSSARALAQIREAACSINPFYVELGDVCVFPKTDVIYIATAAGSAELSELYSTLHTGVLHGEQHYRYVPHVTLAQNLHTDEVDELLPVAKQQWAAWNGPRRFRVEALTFVHSANHARSAWVDVGSVPLTATACVA